MYYLDLGTTFNIGTGFYHKIEKRYLIDTRGCNIFNKNDS